MAKVTIRENEDLETLLKRFKRRVRDDGILDECKKREFFLKKSLKLKKKTEQARIRNRKKK